MMLTSWRHWLGRRSNLFLKGRVGKQARAKSCRLRIEALEDRQLLAVFTVSTTANAGAGSLRQAILDANANPGSDTIEFRINSGVQTISPTSGLPTITDPATIDGTTQPGFKGWPLIELDGSAAGSTTSGLVLSGGRGTVRSLVINRFGHAGLVLQANGNNVLAGNFIGTDVTGTVARGNDAWGVIIRATSDNTIGGPAARNLISGNREGGILVEGVDPTPAARNVIQGNFLGTDATGTAALGNGNGVYLRGLVTETAIGGTAAGAGNLISGNLEGGIQVPIRTPTGNNRVQGNFIGTDLTGTRPLGNRDGMMLDGSNNLVGGTAVGAGNLISGNRRYGVLLGYSQNPVRDNVVRGNRVGTDITGTQALGNGDIGVYVNGMNATVGGAEAGAGNLVSANGNHGIVIGYFLSSGNAVRGNIIGTDITGTQLLGNRGDGVNVNGFDNAVGGAAAGAGNFIAGNGGNGIFILFQARLNTVQGNFIGFNTRNGVYLDIAANDNTIGGAAAGAANVIANNGRDGVLVDQAVRAALRGNALWGHPAGLGIRLVNGGNNNQAAPQLAAAGSFRGRLTIGGSLRSAPGTTYALEFFASAACHPSGFGEGQQPVGTLDVTTGDAGDAAFVAGFAAAVPRGWVVTATATDPSGNTSAFSGCVPVRSRAYQGRPLAENLVPFPGREPTPALPGDPASRARQVGAMFPGLAALPADPSPRPALDDSTRHAMSPALNDQADGFVKARPVAAGGFPVTRELAARQEDGGGDFVLVETSKARAERLAPLRQAVPSTCHPWGPPRVFV